MNYDTVFGSFEELDGTIKGLVESGGPMISQYADYGRAVFGYLVSDARQARPGDTVDTVEASPVSQKLLVWKKFGVELSGSSKDAPSLAELVAAMGLSTVTTMDPASGYLMVVDYSGANEQGGWSSKTVRLSLDAWNGAPMDQKLPLKGVFRLRRWQETLGLAPVPPAISGFRPASSCRIPEAAPSPCARLRHSMPSRGGRLKGVIPAVRSSVMTPRGGRGSA